MGGGWGGRGGHFLSRQIPPLVPPATPSSAAPAPGDALKVFAAVFNIKSPSTVRWARAEGVKSMNVPRAWAQTQRGAIFFDSILLDYESVWRSSRKKTSQKTQKWQQTG